MLDFLYTNGWGAFAVMLFFQLPFLYFFIKIVYRKAYIDKGASETESQKYPMMEGIWITTVVALFVLVNVLSVVYMPPVTTAAMIKQGGNFQEVDVTARSWFYEISEREYEVGRPVIFNAKSIDTVHGFAVYHPDGRILFTMMLVPGMEEASTLVHTFTEAGNYKVRCLEYCGIVHHGMQDVLVVR
ncbi:MAG: hypothetical protein HN351_03055 [Deltaproteobacteria bacterium]|jgi:cytochrome c oxidase subunit 2|nr:hypothetical protein [Deltaproteobacteria bacterium]